MTLVGTFNFKNKEFETSANFRFVQKKELQCEVINRTLLLYRPSGVLISCCSACSSSCFLFHAAFFLSLFFEPEDGGDMLHRSGLRGVISHKAKFLVKNLWGAVIKNITQFVLLAINCVKLQNILQFLCDSIVVHNKLQISEASD